MSESPELDLPDDLSVDQRALLTGMCEMWLRLSDFRFGQLFRMVAAVDVRYPRHLSDEALMAGIEPALTHVHSRACPPGPVGTARRWDRETS